MLTFLNSRFQCYDMILINTSMNDMMPKRLRVDKFVRESKHSVNYITLV